MEATHIRTQVRKTSFAAIIVAVAIVLSLAGCTRNIVGIDTTWKKYVDPHRHTINIGNQSMHYIDLGSGTPVVMIHGIGDSTYSWHKNAAALVDAGMRVILIDQPGFGYSSIPDKDWSYSVENQAEMILQVVDKLGINRFNLVGHSLGGGEALYLTWKHPDRLLRGVVISPVSERTSCPFGYGSDLLASVTGTRWFIKKALKSAFYQPDKVSDIMIDEYARFLDRPDRMGTGVMGGVCKSYFSPTYDRMTQSYKEVKPELLIIWGDQDTWHPLAFGSRLQANIPRSRLEIIPQAGHNVQQEKPEVVNPLLITFLQED